MSYNGSGTFVINTAGQPVVSGTVISSTAFNALTADLATGLSTAITKDGQTTPTANIPMGNNKITGLAVGTAATDAANLSQVQSTAAKLVNSVSGVDTITGTMSPTLAAYAAGQMFYFVAAGDNTGAVTLNLDGLGAKSVTRDGSVALAAGDIKSGEVVVVVYDGTRFQVVSQLNSAGNATFANVSITSALNVGGVATFSGGTANGVTYLNASKALTSGSALVFDGTNLGIGTSSPAYKLQVSTNANADATINASNTTDGTNSVARFLAISNAGSVWFGMTAPSYNAVTGASDACLINTGNASNGICFANDGVLQMKLDSSGNLGIGTSSPADKLDVNGAIRLGDQYELKFGGTTATIFGSSSLNQLRFYTNNTERVRIDSSGNLGLGVTPSAWGTDYRALQVSGGVTGALWTSVSKRLVLSNNMFVNSAGDDKYIATDYASRYDQISGQHQWRTAASGTAGNTISFTQAMTLDADGDLGVGITAPSCRLDLAGPSTAGLTNLVQLRTGSGNSFGFQIKGDHSTDGYLVQNYYNSYLAFGTNNTERARITSGGDVGIGTTSPYARFQAYQSSSTLPAAWIYRGTQGSDTNLPTTFGYPYLQIGAVEYRTNSIQTIGFGYVSTNGNFPPAEIGLQTISTSGETYGDLVFATRSVTTNTAATERARILSGGGLCVGTTSNNSGAVLQVKGSGSTSATYNCYFENSSGSRVFSFEDAGKFVTGTLTDSPYYYVVGGTNRDLYIDSTGAIGITTSVRASKTNITPVVDTDWLLQLNPVTFHFRKKDADGNYTDEVDGPLKHGLIAEEVEEVNADLCFYDDENKGGALRGVNYSHLVTPMLKLIQKQQAAIAALEAKVAALEAK